MAFPLLGLLTSPIAKIGLGVVSKVVEGVKHKNELKSIQRNAELAAKQSIDYAEIEARKAVSNLLVCGYCSNFFRANATTHGKGLGNT
jgi:hypothetical protein